MTNETKDALPAAPTVGAGSAFDEMLGEDAHGFKNAVMASGLRQRVIAERAALLAEVAELREGERELRDVLLRAGFVMCDAPACNCGSWHHRYGLSERMQEICDELSDADVLDNSTGNRPLTAIRKLREQRDAAEKRAELAEANLAGMGADARRLREIEHRCWHVFDESEDTGDAYIISKVSCDHHLTKLFAALPEDHPEVTDED